MGMTLQGCTVTIVSYWFVLLVGAVNVLPDNRSSNRWISHRLWRFTRR